MKPSPNPARPPRLLIVEEALRSTGFGHWCEYIKTIAEGCRAEGVDVTIAAHRDAEPTIREWPGVKCVLRYSAWDNIYDSPSALRRYLGVLRHNCRLNRDVQALLEQSEPFDCVLAPTNLAHHALGWHWIARKWGGRKFRHLAMIFVNTPGNRKADGSFHFPRNTFFLRTVLRRMRKYQRAGWFTPVAETRRAAEQFKAFCGMEFASYPHVVGFPPATRPAASVEGREPTLASFGFARHDKGSDLLQEAAARLLREPPAANTRFVFQWGADFRDDSGRLVGKAKELQADPRVEFIDRPLGTQEYLARLNQVDGLVLPYRARAYYDRVSRVAIEAACLGLPFIHPRNSWLADLAQSCGAGVGFTDGDVGDLTRAMREFARRLESLRAEARERSVQARRYFSPSRFKACLFQESDELSGLAF